MRNLLLVLLGMSLFPPDANAQGVVCFIGPMTPGYNASADQAPAPRVAKDLKRIVGLLCPKGCGRVGLFKNATAPSAMAMTVGNGTTKIAYSAVFLDRVQDAYGSDASFGILAHEVGHHVDVNGSPAGWMDPSWNNEVRADAWAACALGRAGMRIEGLAGALRAVSTSQAGLDPIWETRAGALQRGYDSCGGGAMMKLASVVALPSTAKLGGCAGNNECRAGRLCVEGRCQDRVARGVCLKDVDCPDREICGSTGRCELPAGASPLDANATVVSLAADDKRSSAADCHKQCEADRRRCRVSAVKSLNECLGRVRTDPEYTGCGCPNWPANKPECHRVCEDSFETSERCESEYVPAREACFSANDCGSCDSASPGQRTWGRESALK